MELKVLPLCQSLQFHFLRINWKGYWKGLFLDILYAMTYILLGTYLLGFRLREKYRDGEEVRPRLVFSEKILVKVKPNSYNDFKGLAIDREYLLEEATPIRVRLLNKKKKIIISKTPSCVLSQMVLSSACVSSPWIHTHSGVIQNRSLVKWRFLLKKRKKKKTLCAKAFVHITADKYILRQRLKIFLTEAYICCKRCTFPFNTMKC